MKKYLFFSIVICCLSCTKNDILPAKNKDNNPSVLKFENIRYTIEESDGVNNDTIPFKPFVFTNKTSVKQVSIFQPDLKEYFIFKNDSASFDGFLKDSVKVNVPYGLLPDNDILFSKHPVLLSDTLTSRPATYTIKDSLFVQPNTEMTFNAKLINKVITATYYVTFKDTASGIEHIFRGKLTGTTPFSIQSETNYNNIK